MYHSGLLFKLLIQMTSQTIKFKWHGGMNIKNNSIKIRLPYLNMKRRRHLPTVFKNCRGSNCKTVKPGIRVSGLGGMSKLPPSKVTSGYPWSLRELR